MEQFVEGEAPDVASIPPGNGFATKTGPAFALPFKGAI